MSRRLSRIFLFLVIALTSSSVFAQSANTSLRGVIKDPTGALVSGAKVNLVDNATGLSYSADANASGEYQFTRRLSTLSLSRPPASRRRLASQNCSSISRQPSILLSASPQRRRFSTSQLKPRRSTPPTPRSETQQITTPFRRSPARPATSRICSHSSPVSSICLRPQIPPCRIAAAAQSTGNVPTRATLLSMASTTTIRSTASLSLVSSV